MKWNSILQLLSHVQYICAMSIKFNFFPIYYYLKGEISIKRSQHNVAVAGKCKEKVPKFICEG